MSDCITISRLRVSVFIGVPDEERAESQEVEFTLEMTPERSLHGTEDEISATVDYYEVSLVLIQVAQERPRKLLELLNEEILHAVLQKFPVKHATLTTFKYIIPETEHVSVKMSLSKAELV